MHRDKLQAVLRTLASGKRDNLSREEARVLALWPDDVSNDTLAAAVRRIRFQQGLPFCGTLILFTLLKQTGYRTACCLYSVSSGFNESAIQGIIEQGSLSWSGKQDSACRRF